MIGSGSRDPGARGMAYAALVRAYDFNQMKITMPEEALLSAQFPAIYPPLLVSNHSYGTGVGWDGNRWWGDAAISATEDYKFGFYDVTASELDELAVLAPYWLIVKAAGNSRGICGPGGSGQDCNGGLFGYDCIPTSGVSKNILTVGWVQESGGTISMGSTSSWGPSDDGRVKPDIVSEGYLWSTLISIWPPYQDYIGTAGTSQAAATVTGSIALLQEHAINLRGAPLRSSAMKALVLHTATDMGRDGPDYEYGWGLMNTETAAQVLTAEGNGTHAHHVYDSLYLEDSGTLSIPMYVNRSEACTEPLKVTICWTDPPGTPLTPALNDQAPMLVNDVDLLVKGPASTSHQPWILEGLNAPTSTAARGRNSVDNVEQVLIDDPASGYYEIVINHTGNLTGGHQIVSLIVTGNSERLISDSRDATALNSQRKCDYTGDEQGYWQAVYENAGEVWYVESTDQGTTWSQEKRISDGTGVSSHPSIFSYPDGGVVTWKEADQIRLAVIPAGIQDSCDQWPIVTWNQPFRASFTTPFPPTPDAAPVVAGTGATSVVQSNTNTYFMVVYETEYDLGGQTGAALAYLWFQHLNLVSYGFIPNADLPKVNPPVTPSLTRYRDYLTPEFHLAWRQNDTVWYSKLTATVLYPLTLTETQHEAANYSDAFGPNSPKYPASGAPSICPYWSTPGPDGTKQDAVIAYRIDAGDQFSEPGIEVVYKDSLGSGSSIIHPVHRFTVATGKDVWAPSVMSTRKYETQSSPDHIRYSYNYNDGAGDRSIYLFSIDNQTATGASQVPDSENPSTIAFPPHYRELALFTEPVPVTPEAYRIGATEYMLAKRSEVLRGVSVPSFARLEQNYPNPFSGETEIRYSLRKEDQVTLSVTDILGRQIVLLVRDHLNPGQYSIRFDGADLPSGIYLCRLATSAGSQTRILTVTR